MIEYINQHYDWFETMQMGLGHDSWWYTNRKPEDCINVKIYAWLDIDKLLEKLTDREKQIVDTLELDVPEYCNDLVWNDYGLVYSTRECLLEVLKENYNVVDCEYGGKQGGWLAVIYQWDDVPDDYDNDEYSYQEVKQFYNTIKKSITEHEKVTEMVLEMKKLLEKDIKNVETYLDQVHEYIANQLEAEL